MLHWLYNPIRSEKKYRGNIYAVMLSTSWRPCRGRGLRFARVGNSYQWSFHRATRVLQPKTRIDLVLTSQRCAYILFTIVQLDNTIPKTVVSIMKRVDWNGGSTVRATAEWYLGLEFVGLALWISCGLPWSGQQGDRDPLIYHTVSVVFVVIVWNDSILV